MIQAPNNNFLSKDNWNDHWKTKAESATANPAQDYRRKIIFKSLKLDQVKGPVRVLDIGSGQGDFTLQLQSARPDAEILGLELSQSGVEISQKKNPTATFIQQDLLKYAVPQNPFKEWAQFAVCSEVLEHVEEPQKILTHIRPYLAPKSILVITVPGGPMSTFDKHIGHRKHFQRSELEELVQKSGFSIEKISCSGFPFFNLYRMIVILRGKKLIQDAATPKKKMPLLARFFMILFSKLFQFNLDHHSLGWQIICVARKKD